MPACLVANKLSPCKGETGKGVNVLGDNKACPNCKKPVSGSQESKKALRKGKKTISIKLSGKKQNPFRLPD